MCDGDSVAQEGGWRNCAIYAILRKRKQSAESEVTHVLMVENITQLSFDFNDIGALRRLEDILCSGHWSERGLNDEDMRTKFLLQLLQAGAIIIYKREYIQKFDASPKIQQRANALHLLMGKRNIGQAVLDIADIFFDYAYEPKTIYNSIYFPKLKAFVRNGNLPPERLFELLEYDDCDTVMLFSDMQSDGGTFFHAIHRSMPRELFSKELEAMQGRQTEAMREALKQVEG